MDSGKWLMYRRKTLAASCTLNPSQSNVFPYVGGESKKDCSSLMRLADPLTRKIPSTSVAKVSLGQAADPSTSLFQVHSTLCYYNRNAAIYF